MKIRFIVETFTRKRDVNGNTYHCAVITSTLTGKELLLASVDGLNNALGLLRNLLKCEWSEVHSVNIEEMPARDWLRHRAHKSGIYEHEVTADMLTALEVA